MFQKIYPVDLHFELCINVLKRQDQCSVHQYYLLCTNEGLGYLPANAQNNSKNWQIFFSLQNSSYLISYSILPLVTTNHNKIEQSVKYHYNQLKTTELQ